MTKQISIIIACHNYGRYLSDAIHSLVGGQTSLGEFEPQTFQDFDITIVDDASTDGTFEFAKPFLNERISYIRNSENIGTSATLNTGIRQATGQYITFLSADDMMETTRLEKLYAAVLSRPHSFAFDNLMTFANGYRKDLMPLPDYDFEKTLYKNGVHAGILYPRQAWVDVGGYPAIMGDGREDWAYNVALGSHGYCGVHVKEPLYLYRWEGQNRSLTNGGPQNRLKFLAKMQALYPELYRGERPKMCCGSGSKKKAVTSSSSKASNSRASLRMGGVQLVVGSEGMVLLEYQLPKAGTVIYRGEVTGQEYVFSSIRKRGYVDSRDAPALLNRIEDRRHAFTRIIESIQAPVLAIAANPAPQPVQQIETVPLTITEQTTENAPVQKKAKKTK